MNDVRLHLFQILDQIELARTEVLNAKAWSAGEECKKHCKFAVTSLDVAHKMVDELQSGLRSGAVAWRVERCKGEFELFSSKYNADARASQLYTTPQPLYTFSISRKKKKGIRE